MGGRRMRTTAPRCYECKHYKMVEGEPTCEKVRDVKKIFYEGADCSEFEQIERSEGR